MTNILIVGMPRGGSTYLLELLATYNGFKISDKNILDEPFGTVKVEFRSKGLTDESLLPQMFYDRKDYVVDIIKKYPCVIKDHIQNYRSYKEHTGQEFPFKIYDDFYKIKLIRKNFKALVYSLAISKTTRVFNVFNDDTKLVSKVKIESDMLDYAIQHQLDIVKLLYSDKSSYDNILYYEDFSNPIKDQSLINLTKNNIKNIDVSIIKAKNHSDVIENYDEVESLFHSKVNNIKSDIFEIDDRGFIVRNG